MKNIHLICNSHLDPVWLWEWEEGAAEAISTFRTAADFCKQYDGFVFNHNEVILYRWVEEYDPALFARIQKLVKQGKWHIMGGWYLQPDCNMPSGESFVRQALAGLKYFKEKFGVRPTTAINFDSFGHTRGLVQILKKAGFDSYLFTRPDIKDSCPLPADDFVWVGYDGSEVMGHRAYSSYLSLRGEARNKIEAWIKDHPDTDTGLILWGIGNHGGGPSRVDMKNISELAKETDEYALIHSTPEAYFAEKGKEAKDFPRFEAALNPRSVGCYTSQIRIKQYHRRLENELYMTEKMFSIASMQGLTEYPQKELDEAICDLLMSEFHDILPGSSIQPVEEMALRLMDHGLEILSRLKARVFFALNSGQPKAQEGHYPIMVFNPHPYPVTGIFECEFQMADQNWGDDYSLPIVMQNGAVIPNQTEKEHCNLPLDWRKHVVFRATLEPSCMNRFDAVFEKLPKKPVPKLKEKDGYITYITDDIEVKINTKTGLIDKYSAYGKDYLNEKSFRLLVIQDIADSWGNRVSQFRDVIGEFELMDLKNGTAYSGVTKKDIPSVRVIEEGDVQTVVEAVFTYNDSKAVIHYKLPKSGSEMEIQVRTNWNEPEKMIKMSLSTQIKRGDYLGQVAFGVEKLNSEGLEVVSQKWSGLFDFDNDKSLCVINNGTYGSDCCDGEIRLSLLRSPAYSALPIRDRTVMLQDRFSAHIDNGERIFSFWIKADSAKKQRQEIDRDALIHNEKPFALSFYPSGEGKNPKPGVILSGEGLQVCALKKMERQDEYILRIYNPTEKTQVQQLSVEFLQIKQEIAVKPYEVNTYKIDGKNKKLVPHDMMEQ